MHRLVKSDDDDEDAEKQVGFSIANSLYQGANLNNMAVDSNGDVLEIAVYTSDTLARRGNATGRPVVLASAEDHGVLAVDTSDIADPEGFVQIGEVESTGILHAFSYRWIRVDGDTETVVSSDSTDYGTSPVKLRSAAILPRNRS